MKQIHLDNTYTLDNDIIIMCENFAHNVIQTNKDEYFRRNQKDLEKIKKDIITGKIAEWGVYFMYLSRGRKNIEPPDMRVYSKEKKSFDPDLRWGLFKLHIKSQTEESSNRYGDSWIFQSKDPLFDFSNEYDIVIACSVSDNSVTILLEKPFRHLIFGETKLGKFSNNKKALYLKDNNE